MTFSIDSAALTRDDVFVLFRGLLGRDPESEQTIASFVANFQNFAQARNFIATSDEFCNYHSKLIGSQPDEIRYQPERFVPLVRRGFKIALAAIVKDEAENIREMIESCLPIVDYVVIADTGSTDRTREEARETIRRSNVSGAVSSIPFIDFSQARNQALDLVTKDIDWVLMLDADERIVPGDYQKFLDLTLSQAHAIRLPRYNFAIRTGEIINYPDYQHRLIRNNVPNPPRYSRPVHEVIANTDRWDTAPRNTVHLGGASGGPHIHHLGVPRNKEDEPEEKARLYADLEKA